MKLEFLLFNETEKTVNYETCISGLTLLRGPEKWQCLNFLLQN